MPEEAPPYWMLISVLFSTFPMTAALAMTLHQTALDLYECEDSAAPIAGDMLSGSVRNLRKEVVLGSIAGSLFEAELETERGQGQVRFLLTRQGLEHLARPKKRELLN